MHDAGALGVEELPGALERARVERGARAGGRAARLGGEQALGQLEDQAVERQRLERAAERRARRRAPAWRSVDTGSRTNGSGEGRPRSARSGLGDARRARRRRSGSRSRPAVPARPSCASSGWSTTTSPGVLARAAPAVVERLHADVGHADGVGVVAMPCRRPRPANQARSSSTPSAGPRLAIQPSSGARTIVQDPRRRPTWLLPWIDVIARRSST